jgi:hypothetical protein
MPKYHLSMYRARQDSESSHESAPEDPRRSSQPRLTEEEIDDRYQKGYKDHPGLGPDFEGWARQGVWPEE